MKKIDKIILVSFAGPFLMVFVVIVFILLSRHMLFHFDDIVGKDLGWRVVSQLLFYFTIFMIPVAMPLAVLLSSLLTFGNLGEHFELTAMKSAGISLLRTIRPIFLLVLLLTGISFYINNNLVPKAALQAYSLMYDIKQKKPALDLKEGIFYNGLPDISIKIDRRYPDGITLQHIVLYDHRNDQGNTEVIIADSGRMSTILDGHYLRFELFNGFNYSEGISVESEVGRKQSTPAENLTRRRFGKYQVVFDLASFKLPQTSKQAFATHRIMRNLKELDMDIDSLNRKVVQQELNYRSSAWRRHDGLRGFTTQTLPDAAFIDSLYKLPASASVLKTSTNSAREVKSRMLGSYLDLENYRKEKVFFELQWHRIVAGACMCIAMFLIGAPLGAIIKRGGLGIPFLVSIGFFVVYYILTMQGEKLAVQGIFDPATGVWMPAGIFLCIGIILLEQARVDARLFEGDNYRFITDRILKILRRIPLFRKVLFSQISGNQ
ncbi:MAG: LptF/LptG family permease [Chryseosolibacter sp.]